MTKIMRYSYVLSVIFLFLVCSCNTRTNEHANINGTTITTDAHLLKLVDCGDYLYAEVRADATDSLPLAKYAIVDSGASPASLPEGCLVINAPLKNTIVSSSVHTSGINELGKLDAISGVTDVSYYVPEDPVYRRVQEGKIANVGASFSPDIEKIIDLNPDGIIITPYEGDGYNELKKLKIPKILMTDYLEPTPLGRAEWIMFIGALYGRFDEAREIYRNVSDKYQRLRVCAANCDNTPLIITEKPMSGVWYVPGGGSYVATLISDAAATYPWYKTKEAGSIPMDVSSVINAGSDAEFWLIKDAKDLTEESLLAEVPHAKAFKAFPDNVYVCNTIEKPYFNAAAFHPELILEDMVAIFHKGECEAGPELRFFRPLVK